MEHRQTAQDIIETNISHPVAELRRRKARVQAQIDEILGQTTKELKAGMKNGVDVIEADGKAVRVSNNAPWFQTFWNENKRYPKQYELEQIARDIVTNTTSKYNTEAIAPTSEEEAAYNEELKITLDDLLSQRDMYDSIEGKIKDIQPGDIVATATLSPEARQIYTMQLNALRQSNKEVSATARAAAILSARMADRLAAYAQEAGQEGVTALDFATRVIPNAAEDATGGLMQEVNKQAEEIRAKYEGTDQWLKAPNGKDSNLSERLWCVVRTEAFKNWFGDWENNPANASKVVDENGEPKVMYHGTPYGGFYTFKAESYFTADKEYADIYQTPSASSNRSYYDPATNPMTYEVFLNIKKPFDTRKPEIRKIFENEFYRKWGNGAPLSDKGLPDWTDATDLLEFIEENEYDFDGIILDEGATGGYGDEVKSRGVSYVPVNPAQIKSIDNNGNFDADNPNIYYQNKFSRPAGIIKEAGELYQKAVEKFPEIKEEGVENLVKDAIQTTLDFGENNNESNNLQKRSGRTNAGRKRQRTGALRKGQPRRRLAEKQNKRGKFLGLGITRALVNDGAVSLVGNTIHSPADLAEIAQVLRHPGYEKMHYVYADDTGKIVFHETISCMLPAESAIFSKEIQADKRGIPTAFGEHVLHTFAKYKLYDAPNLEHRQTLPSMR